MLDIFVVPSNQPNADIEKTIDSFVGIKLEYDVIPVSSCKETNNSKNEWRLIIWDNEYIDEALRDAIPVFLNFNQYEILILYKKISEIEATWRYRLFRNHIYLAGDFCPVGVWFGREAILDGWVKEHDTG